MPLDLNSGVSIIVPVYNGGCILRDVLDAIFAQQHCGPMEVIVVDDQSDDDSLTVLTEYAQAAKIVLMHGRGEGAAAAINLAVHHARYPIICQIDQDVVIQPGWLVAMVEALTASPKIAAVQAPFSAQHNATIWPRIMDLDLKQRYARIEGGVTDHICTGNTVYRASAIKEIGLFDESLGYGYDNDLSYRLGAAGYQLRLTSRVAAVHHWRQSFTGYVMQQYGLGYGRLDLITRHPNRVCGDRVSGVTMIGHAAGTACAIGMGLLGVLLTTFGWPAHALIWASLAVLALFGIERFISGVYASIRYRTPVGLLFPVVHLVRDISWAIAIYRWLGRGFVAVPRQVEHSMRRIQS